MAAPMNRVEIPDMKLSKTIYLLFTLLLTSFSCLEGQITIQQISENSFNQFINSNEYALVYFTTDHCQECTKQEVQLTRIEENKVSKDVKIVKTDSEKLAKIHGVRKYPTLMYFRKALPIIYDAGVIDGYEVVEWLEQSKASASTVLKDDTFEHLTQAATGSTTGDWLVLFYRQEDGCKHLLAALETVTTTIKLRTNTARVNLAASPQLRHRFEIKQCPTLILFRHGKQYTYDLPDTSVNALLAFTEGGYKNFHGVPVRPEPSPFDNLVDSIILKLEVVPKAYRAIVIIGGFFIFAGVLLLILWLCSKPTRTKLD